VTTATSGEKPVWGPARPHIGLLRFVVSWILAIADVILGCLFRGIQTVLTALGWYGILRYAYPGGVTYIEVLASYAAGVALNNFVPANLGTFVTLLMFVAVVAGATFAGVLAGYVFHPDDRGAKPENPLTIGHCSLHQVPRQPGAQPSAGVGWFAASVAADSVAKVLLGALVLQERLESPA
jgi:hypothetical protein